MQVRSQRWGLLRRCLCGFRIASGVGLGLLAIVTGLSQGAPPEPGLPQRLSPDAGAREGAALVANLLSEHPEVSVTNPVALLVSDAAKKQTRISARFVVLAGPERSTNVYETVGPASSPGASMKLMVIREPGSTNRCFLSQPVDAASKPIAGNETMVRFAGSDFWVADLSLEFLQWPTQVVTRKEMRRGQFCAVLESVNPNRSPSAYSRVVSWIAINRPGVAIVFAEAYDTDNKLLKQFAPKKLEKVDGQWQLDEMEIRNRQTGSRTRIDLNPE